MLEQLQSVAKAAKPRMGAKTLKTQVFPTSQAKYMVPTKCHGVPNLCASALQTSQNLQE